MNLDLNFDTIVRLIFYPFLILFIAIFIFITIKTVKSYKKRNPVDNEIVILTDEIDGSSAEIISDMKLPLPIIGNNYSISFNLKLDSSAEKTKEYTIFSRGFEDKPEMKLSILPYSESNSNTLRLLFKINNLDDDENENTTEHTHEHIHTPYSGEHRHSSTEYEEDKEEEDEKEKDETFKNTPPDYLKTQTNEVSFSNTYKESFFANINSQNKDNFISTNPLTERFDENTDKISEFLKNDDVKKKLEEYKLQNLSVELEKKLSQKEDTCNTLVEVNEYDYCDLMNNNTDTTFHITLTVYNNVIDVYKNSDLVSSCVLKGEPNPSFTPFKFLSHGGFKGSIGQFSFFNITLNSDQVKTIYQRDINKLLPRDIFNLNN